MPNKIPPIAAFSIFGEIDEEDQDNGQNGGGGGGPSLFSLSPFFPLTLFDAGTFYSANPDSFSEIDCGIVLDVSNTTILSMGEFS